MLEQILYACGAVYGAVCIGSMLLGVVEMCGPPLWMRWLYRVGPVVHTRNLSGVVHRSWLEKGVAFESAHLIGKGDGTKIRFRFRYCFPRMWFRWKIPIKGEISLRAPARVRVRCSLGLIGFMVLWLVGWAGAGLIIAGSKDAWVDQAVWLIGLVVGVAMLVGLWVVSRRGARWVAEEAAGRIAERAQAE